MQIQRVDTSPVETDADAIVVAMYENSPPGGAAAAVDQACGGALGRLLERKEITGKRNEVITLYQLANVKSPLVVAVGLGDRDKRDRAVVAEACGAAAKKLADKPRGQVAYFVDDGWSDELVEAGIYGLSVGSTGQDLYRTEKKFHPPATVLWVGSNDVAVERGRVLGESTNFTRRLVNGSPQDVYPDSVAQTAADLCGQYGLAGEIWDEVRLEEERCAALLAVARGSARPPRLVIVRYHGGWDGDPPLALVGKGVTFDSGGLSIKPTDGMLTMKCDMAGAATVLGAIQAIARLALPVNVIGLIGLVENMISGEAYKLGDVITARNGKTIEIHNTDAEGRVVLADVLSVAVERGAAKIIDLATLTGACMVALGTDIAGAMTNNQPWCDTVMSAAAACGERLWQLPMFELFDEHIKSQVADIKNVGDGRWGGAITAAKFLEQFVGETPWTHLDIAGPAFYDKPKAWVDAGASGQYVRTLVEVARRWAEG